MSERILVPVLGESVTEATVAKWLKNEGDRVNVDEAIIELETDKVNIEVPAPFSGTIEKILVKEGETVNVGASLGTIIQSQSNEASASVEEKKYSPPPKKMQVVRGKEEESTKEVKLFEKERKQKSEEEPLILTDVHNEKKVSRNQNINIVSPAARKLATEFSINLN
jgi:2-oxoglutarate dehydrogenase E2 component (dihydrolipoamide succinyltransferase)